MSTPAPKLTILVPFRVRYYEVVNLYQHAVVAGTAAVGGEWELAFTSPKMDKSARAAIEALVENDLRVKFSPVDAKASHIEAWEAALDVAEGDYIFHLGDANGPINRLPEIMQFATGGVDSVNCKRTAPEGAGFGKLLGFAFGEMGRALNGETGDLNETRLMSRLAAEAVAELPKGERFDGPRIADESLRQVEFKYPEAPPAPARFMAMEEVIEATSTPQPKPMIAALEYHGEALELDEDAALAPLTDETADENDAQDPATLEDLDSVDREDETNDNDKIAA
ncbi:MAG: hypothetical protein AAGL49_10335 [Pseudomonadota bacterium]